MNDNSTKMYFSSKAAFVLSVIYIILSLFLFFRGNVPTGIVWIITALIELIIAFTLRKRESGRK